MTYIYKSNHYDYPNVTDILNGKHTYIDDMLKKLFKELGYDEDNPLKQLIKKGDIVLIKPNMVMDKNGIEENGTDCLYTNPSIVACLIPYILKVLDNTGKIVIADAPMQSCDFENLIEISGYNKIIEHYKRINVNIEIVDLRGLKSVIKKDILNQEVYNDESIIIDLGKDSLHAQLDEKQINNERITSYDPSELSQHHTKNKHEYSVSKLVLEADCIINICKPKSHRKNGVTIGMKNFIGISTRKEYLPHHRIGCSKTGGDEYKSKSIFLKFHSKFLDKYNKCVFNKKYAIAKFYKFLSKVLNTFDKIFIKNKFREGSWYGNDTIWRTIIDINKIINYADKNGKICNGKKRNILYIADMIVIGEGEGPLMPSAKNAGILAMSTDVVDFDLSIATIMGFDVKKINLYKYIINNHNLDLKSILIKSNDSNINDVSIEEFKYINSLKVKPTDGYIGHIELDK